MTALALANDLPATSMLELEVVTDNDLVARLREEIAELDMVATAAVLATTAFRLKDERGLVASLRKLAAAVEALERARAEA